MRGIRFRSNLRRIPARSHSCRVFIGTKDRRALKPVSMLCLNSVKDFYVKSTVLNTS